MSQKVLGLLRQNNRVTIVKRNTHSPFAVSQEISLGERGTFILRQKSYLQCSVFSLVMHIAEDGNRFFVVKYMKDT